MSKFLFHQIGPWPLGMAWIGRQSDLPETALSDAVNVDIRPEGSVVTARDWEQVLAAKGCSSLYRHAGANYGVVDGDVCIITPTGVEPMMPVDGAVSWAEVGHELYFATKSEIWKVSGRRCERVSGAGDRDEMDFDDPLAPMPGGQWLDYWNGRLLVARGAKLLFSAPMRYGMHNPMTDYVFLGSRIEWVVALETGIYVGTRDRVIWMAGSKPSELSLREVAGKSAPGMAIAVDGQALGEDSRARYAVFFTRSGFAVGDSSGTVRYPQASRFSDLPLYRGKLVVDNNRIYAVRA